MSAVATVRTRTYEYKPYAVIDREWDFGIVGMPMLRKNERIPFRDLKSAVHYAESLVEVNEKTGYECHQPSKYTWVCRKDTLRNIIKVEGPDIEPL